MCINTGSNHCIRRLLALTAALLLLSSWIMPEAAATQGGNSMPHWITEDAMYSDNAQLLTHPAGSAGTAHWSEPLDISSGIDLIAHWHAGTPLPGPDHWGESMSLSLENPSEGGILLLTLYRYRNGSGHYHILLRSQYRPGASDNYITVTETWSSVVTADGSGNALTDATVRITRDSLREALQIRLYNGSESILSIALQPRNFTDATAADHFRSSILNGSVTLTASAPGHQNTVWQLTAPTVAAPDNTVQQSFFTASAAWEAYLNQDGLSFSAIPGQQGQIKYRRPLLTAESICYSFDITTEKAAPVMELRNSSGSALFRFHLQGEDSALSGEGPNGEVLFDALRFPSDPAGISVCVRVEDGVAAVQIADHKGTLLCQAETAHEFFSGSSLNLVFDSNAGNYTLSGFRGLPRVVTPDCRSLPFSRVVFAGDFVGNWADILLSDLEEFQSAPPKSVVTAMDAGEIIRSCGDLIVLSGGIAEHSSGIPAEDYAASVRTLIRQLQSSAPLGAVILVTGLPNAPDYNAAIRAAAGESDVLYAPVDAALGTAPWAWHPETGLTSTGQLLTAGAVLQTLMRNCTCLAVNAVTQLQVTMMTPKEKSLPALNALRTAEDLEAMEKAVESAALGADLALYRSLDTASQAKVLETLLSQNRSGVADHIAADALINRTVLQVLAENPPAFFTGAPFTTYVAVGDSVSAGEVTANRATEGWVPRFAALVSDAQGQEVRLINNAISGTRMCTITDNLVFPAAKDTVQDYIVSHQPDLLTIAYGFNDINAGTTLEEFIDTYRAYLTELRNSCPDTVVVICSIYATPGDQNGATIRRWNEALKALAEEFGLIYADTYYDILGSGWLIADGVHPTCAGHRVMADAIFRTLCGHVDLTGNTTNPPEPEPTVTEPVVTEPEPTASPEPPAKEAPSFPISLLAAALTVTAGVLILWLRKRRSN